MLTKREIASLTIFKKTGGKVPYHSEKYDERYIMKIADMAMAFLIKKQFFTIRKEDSYNLPDEFFKVFKNQPIEYDSSRDAFYSELPSSLLSIPDSRGLRVYPMKDQKNPFIQVPGGSYGAWNELECNDILGKKGYWIEGNEIIYQNLPQVYEDGNVLIKMITTITDLDPDEKVSIPEDLELELIELISEFLNEKKQTPEDLVNDNNAAL